MKRQTEVQHHVCNRWFKLSIKVEIHFANETCDNSEELFINNANVVSVGDLS